MNGKILVESEEGVGSCFSFIADFDTVEVPQKIGAEAIHSTQFLGNLEGPVRNILLVEDDVSCQILIKRLLQNNKIDVQVINDGKVALQFIGNKRYDLIILDIQLPEISGLDILKSIRKEEMNSQVPVVALTAYALKDDREFFMKMGFDEYVAKPIHLEKFRALLLKYIS